MRVKEERQEGRKEIHRFPRACPFPPDNKQILKIIFWVKGLNPVVSIKVMRIWDSVIVEDR